MSKELIINARSYETRVALVEDGTVVEVYSERKTGQERVGSIYRGSVTRVLPGMQAAFVDIGLERAAFLYVSDVQKDLLNIEDAMIGDFCEEDSDPVGSETFQSSQFDGISFTINDLLHEGQHIMVQISKEPLGEKGARLTSYISLPGRHLVLMPTVDHIGVSRRIQDKNKKNRLKEIIREIRPGNAGFIIRTAGEDASEKTLKSEMDFLIKLWSDIRGKMEKQSGPGLLHKDLHIALRTVRDLFTKEVDRLVIDSNHAYKKIMEFINAFAPGLKYSVEFYDGRQPIFEFFGIEDEIGRALETNIQLKSGGHIVIERTEALTSIDVNTGRYVGKTNLEETIVKTNLEAVKEIAHQLRFRNIGGIIVIDFISMEKESNRQRVYEALKNVLSKDKAQTNVLPMSDLGLVEMTRKRTRKSLNRLLTEPCRHCEGRGRRKSKKSICYEIFRDIERESALSGENGDILVSVNPSIESVLKEEEQGFLADLENKLGKKIVIRSKEAFHPDQYEIYA